MNTHWIFSISITSINLVLTVINWRILRTIRRPYDPEALKRANKQWRSNMNFEIGRLMREQAQKAYVTPPGTDPMVDELYRSAQAHLDEKNKTQE